MRLIETIVMKHSELIVKIYPSTMNGASECDVTLVMWDGADTDLAAHANACIEQLYTYVTRVRSSLYPRIRVFLYVPNSPLSNIVSSTPCFYIHATNEMHHGENAVWQFHKWLAYDGGLFVNMAELLYPDGQISVDAFPPIYQKTFQSWKKEQAKQHRKKRWKNAHTAVRPKSADIPSKIDTAATHRKILEDGVSESAIVFHKDMMDDDDSIPVSTSNASNMIDTIMKRRQSTREYMVRNAQGAEMVMQKHRDSNAGL